MYTVILLLYSTAKGLVYNDLCRPEILTYFHYAMIIRLQKVLAIVLVACLQKNGKFVQQPPKKQETTSASTATTTSHASIPLPDANPVHQQFPIIC